MTSPLSNAPAKTDDSGNRMVHCSTIEDFFQPASRALIGTLTRAFLDQMVLTPTELLCSSRNYSRLDGAGTLLRDALEKAGSLQARLSGQKSYDRVRELRELTDQVAQLMFKLDQDEPANPVKPGHFLEMVREVRAVSEPHMAEIRIFRNLTEALGLARKWTEKIDLVLGLVREASHTRELHYIDNILAEVLQSDTAQDTILGRRVSVEDRIDDLVDLFKGCYPSRPNIATPLPAAVDLNEILINDDFPETRAAIETSIVQFLASRNNLRSPELLVELQATHALLGRMRQGDRVIGGRRALEFIDKRMGRMLNEETISDYIRSAGGLSDRVTLLLQIYQHTFGPNNRKVVESFITRYFADEDFERRLLVGEGPPQHKLKMLANLYKVLMTTPLPASEKAAYAAKLINIQANYIANSRMFAAIEKQNATSARKCAQVLSLCLDGSFIPGDNLERAKALVRHYLGRPDFADRYLDGCPTPAHKREMIASLKEQLDQLSIELPPFRV